MVGIILKKDKKKRDNKIYIDFSIAFKEMENEILMTNAEIFHKLNNVFKLDVVKNYNNIYTINTNQIERAIEILKVSSRVKDCLKTIKSLSSVH